GYPATGWRGRAKAIAPERLPRERREAPRQVKAWPRQAASKLAYLPPFACLLWHAVSPREERCQSSVGRQQGSAKNRSRLIGQSWHVEKTCRQIIGTSRYRNKSPPAWNKIIRRQISGKRVVVSIGVPSFLLLT